MNSYERELSGGIGGFLRPGWSDGFSSFRAFNDRTFVEGFQHSCWAATAAPGPATGPYVGDARNDRISSFLMHS